MKLYLIPNQKNRLVKEMRLLGISNKKEGTRYFREVYLPKHNQQFALAPKENADLHRALRPSEDLSLIFTKQSQRIVSKDLVVCYKNLVCELQPKTGSLVLRRANVTVTEDSKNKITIRYKGQEIPYRIVRENQERLPQVVTSKSFIERQVQIPGPNHPWRHFRI